MCGTLSIPDMPKKSAKTIKSDQVKLYKYELDSNYQYIDGYNNVQKGEINGIWIKARMKMPSGNTIIRSYCLPENLNEKQSWTTSSKKAGIN